MPQQRNLGAQRVVRVCVCVKRERERELVSAVDRPQVSVLVPHVYVWVRG